jgi:hypothetical protein
VSNALRDDFFVKVRNNRLQNVGQLLTEGAPPNMQDVFGNTPLHAACQVSCVHVSFRMHSRKTKDGERGAMQCREWFQLSNANVFFVFIF